MAHELMVDGRFDEAWVDNLAPVQLRHHYAELIRNRASRQREQLHIQVSAAAVMADGGKMAKSQDEALSALSDANPRRTIGSDPTEPSAARTLDEAAKVQRSFDETAHLRKK